MAYRLRSTRTSNVRQAKQLVYVEARHDKEVRRTRAKTPYGARLTFWRKDPHCQMCKRQVDYPNGFELDHKTPIWKGGTNDYDNLQVLCPECHAKKTRIEIAEFEKKPAIKRIKNEVKTIW